MVTVAPGITAPDWSLTVPATVPAPPELPAANPGRRPIAPSEKMKTSDAMRLSSMNFLPESHDNFCVELKRGEDLRGQEERGLGAIARGWPNSMPGRLQPDTRIPVRAWEAKIARRGERNRCAPLGTMGRPGWLLARSVDTFHHDAQSCRPWCFRHGGERVRQKKGGVLP